MPLYARLNDGQIAVSGIDDQLGRSGERRLRIYCSGVRGLPLTTKNIAGKPPTISATIRSPTGRRRRQYRNRACRVTTAPPTQAASHRAGSRTERPVTPQPVPPDDDHHHGYEHVAKKAGQADRPLARTGQCRHLWCLWNIHPSAFASALPRLVCSGLLAGAKILPSGAGPPICRFAGVSVWHGSWRCRRGGVR
jgi:hypothetical protein